jgi:hypothetical protein
VTVVIQNKQDINTLRRIIKLYTQATGASINWEKSTGLPIGRWNTNQELDGVQYTDNAKILGINFGTTIAQNITHTWTDKINKIRASIKDFHIRQLDLQQKLRVCNVWLLSTIWYTAQLLPITDDQANQILTIIIQYIWRGSIFRVPITTLYKKATEGGLDMINIKAKCDALYLLRLTNQRQNSDTITAQWLKLHGALRQQDNPPIGSPSQQH